MRYFEVEKEILRGEPLCYMVDADGSPVEGEHDVSIVYEVCSGFNVYVLDEQGRQSTVKFYPVTINTESFTDDSEQVLKQIKADYPAEDGWQNNDW